MIENSDLIKSIVNAVNDKELSDAALRLFLTIKLFHDREKISMGDLQEETGHGRDKLQNAMEVLEEKKYIERKQNIDLGRFGNWTYKTLK